MSKHSTGMTRDQIFAVAEKYGAFEFGDARGDKRLAFAADLIAARERIRDAAPEMLKALQRLTHPAADDSDIENALEVIRQATGGTV